MKNTCSSTFKIGHTYTALVNRHRERVLFSCDLRTTEVIAVLSTVAVVVTITTTPVRPISPIAALIPFSSSTSTSTATLLSTLDAFDQLLDHSFSLFDLCSGTLHDATSVTRSITAALDELQLAARFALNLLDHVTSLSDDDANCRLGHEYFRLFGSIHGLSLRVVVVLFLNEVVDQLFGMLHLLWIAGNAEWFLHLLSWSVLNDDHLGAGFLLQLFDCFASLADNQAHLGPGNHNLLEGLVVEVGWTTTETSAATAASCTAMVAIVHWAIVAGASLLVHHLANKVTCSLDWILCACGG